MAKKLVVVESPAKARTLKKFLGKDFQIKASVGHVKDLPIKDLGVEVENDFKPKYVIIRGKKKVLNEITQAAMGVDEIYLAPDPDREGEAIAWHIAEAITSKNKKLNEKIHRASFYEITQRAVQEAIAHPGKLDPNKFHAQQARRILDRLVGYQISPLLWEKVKRGLSAGRVQSVAVRLICEREKEIRDFVPEEYWTLDALLEGETPPPFTARLIKKGGEKADIKTEKGAKAIIDEIRSKKFEVVEVTRQERKRFAPPPFITSTLQQEAARKLRFTAKKTMLLAQRLYEGVELGPEGSVGLITYMRTDSTRLSNEAVTAVRSTIAEKYGKEYLPPKPNRYKSRKSAQEAHEAIRPTYLDHEPDKIKRYLDKDLFRLYELIWNRFVACQMVPALYDVTTVDIGVEGYLFRVTGSILRFLGFMKVYVEDEDEIPEEAEPEEGRLPELKQGELLKLRELKPEQHFTRPPPRFTESSLVKELEQKGIGRPSTYASILSTIQSKGYVHKKERQFHPTELGELVTELLIRNFPRVMDVKFTARMEDRLDDVEEGKSDWRALLHRFWRRFEEQLAKAKVQMRDVKRQSISTDIDCDKCGQSKMVIRWGRHGEFLSCGTYPECKNIREFERDALGKIVLKEHPATSEVCEKCGSPMALRKGRFGPFLACTGYPECRNTKALEDSNETHSDLTEPCPKGDGKLVVKRARTGHRFLACDNYPKCRETKPFPIGVECPDCGAPLIEKSAKGRRLFYGCSRYPECRYATWDRPAAPSSKASL